MTHEAYTLRPTIPADLLQLEGKPLPFRFRGKTALMGERVIGIGGIGYRDDGSLVAFARITDEFRKMPIRLHKAGLAVFGEARQRGLKLVLATADPDVSRASAWLDRLGFEPIEAAGQTVWVWK